MKYRIKKEIRGNNETYYEPQVMEVTIFNSYMFGTWKSLDYLVSYNKNGYQAFVDAIKWHQSMQVIETEYITGF